MVSGELAGTAPPARPISASMRPLPTIAPAQTRRASRGAGVRHPLGRADGQPAGAEAAVAVEVDHRLFQRRRLAAAFGGDVEVALEVDRGELAARQRARLEAAVGAQDEAVDDDQGAFAGGARGAAAAPARSRERRP